jgi:YrbI family 3-deoxy-D-manno-octulosonate 8-phosphate phosphatase
MNQLPKLVITDIDGVWTDGGMYYDQTGNEFKKFNTSDSAGVLFLKQLDIPLAIITGENTEIVRNRAKKLNIELVYSGISNKVKIADELCDKFNLSYDDIAFIGDDLGDLPLLKKVGFSCCPKNASEYIKKNVHLVLDVKGGDGAFRSFIEYILEKNNLLESCIEKAISF